MIVKCCKCGKDYPLGDNIFECDKDTNCPILVCPYCGFKHIISFMSFDNKIENLKKVEKIKLTTAYPLLGASRIANANRVDQVSNDDLSLDLGWNTNLAVYSNKNVDVSSIDVFSAGFRLSLDGTKMYVMGNDKIKIYQYTLTTPWDISTAVYANKSYFFNEAVARDFGFSADGMKVFILVDEGASQERVSQHNLTIAWDISTASYANQYNISSQTTTPIALSFSTDGTKMYIWSTNFSTFSDCHQYALSTAWTISTTGLTKTVNFWGVIGTPNKFTLRSDGKAFIITETTNVREYPLSTAWDMATYSILGKSKSISAQVTNGADVVFSSDASKMYVRDGYTNIIYQYTLIRGWTKTNDFILATRIYGSKGAYNFAYKLKWRNVTDGGVFADVGATGEISFSADTVLVDDKVLLTGSKRCSVQSGYTWQNGLESEGDNRLPDSNSYSLADEYYTEFQWALDCNDALDEHKYEFALYELTNGTVIGTCGATITIGITQSGFKWNTRTILKWCGKIISKWNTK